MGDNRGISEGERNVERFLASLNVHTHLEMTKILHYPGEDRYSNTSSEPMLLNDHLDAFIRSHPEHVDRIIAYCEERTIGEFKKDLRPLREYLAVTTPLSKGAL